MAAFPIDIAQAVAPGVALTSGIIYYNSLQSRLNVVTSRVRDLNREARAIQVKTTPERLRLESVRWQVDSLTHRAHLLQKAVIAVYFGILGFILSIGELLVMGVYDAERDFIRLANITFGVGLLGILVGMCMSLFEMYFSNRTLVEDVRSTFDENGREQLRKR